MQDTKERDTYSSAAPVPNSARGEEEGDAVEEGERRVRMRRERERKRGWHV